MEVLVKALPRQLKELKLDLTCCQHLTDKGIQKLAKQLNFQDTAASRTQQGCSLNISELDI